MKETRKQREQLLDQIESQIAYYNDILRFRTGGDSTEKKTIEFQRDMLYHEIWEISLTKVAKKYDVPYAKLRAACVKANIPLPTQSYWSSLSVGKEIQKTPLPESSVDKVSIEFYYRESTAKMNILLGKTIPQTENEPLSKPATEKEEVTTSGERIVYDRETLYQEVWEQPVTKVALKYGVSDVMIHKACKALNVPVPPRGYWAKVQAGQKVEKESLPKAIGKDTLMGRDAGNRIGASNVSAHTDKESLSFLSDDERVQLIEIALELRVDSEVKHLHPVLKRHKTEFNAWSKQHPRDKYANWNRDAYRSRQKDEPPLWECVSEESLPRVYRFLDPLYRAVERLGGKILDDLSMQVRNEHVELKITEGRDQTPHALTKDEQRQLDKYEQDKRRYSYAYEPKFRKYDYIPNGKLRIVTFGDNFIRDTSTSGIEDRIGEVLLALYLQSESVRIEREKREEAKRKAEEEKRQREIFRQRYNDEVDKLQALNNEAINYETACRIRAYVAAVEAKNNLDAEKLEWIAWAKAKADWYDPTIAAVDPIFGRRDFTKEANDQDPVKMNPYYW